MRTVIAPTSQDICEDHLSLKGGAAQSASAVGRGGHRGRGMGEGHYLHHPYQGSLRFPRATCGVWGGGWLKEQRSLGPRHHHCRPQASHSSVPDSVSGAEAGVRKGLVVVGASSGRGGADIPVRASLRFPSTRQLTACPWSRLRGAEFSCLWCYSSPDDGCDGPRPWAIALLPLSALSVLAVKYFPFGKETV